MSKATFGQAIHVLNLVHSKSKSLEHLEKLFETGLLSDIIDADLSKIDRNDFRESIYLPRIGFKFRVDYTKPLDKLVVSGKFSRVDDQVTREKIPFQEVHKRAKSWVNAELHTFVHKGTIKGLDDKSHPRDIQKYCMKKLEERGVRGATLEELIAFNVAFPEEGKKRRIFAPGSPVNVVAPNVTWHLDDESGHYNSMTCIYHGALEIEAECVWTSYHLLAIRS